MSERELPKRGNARQSKGRETEVRHGRGRDRAGQRRRRCAVCYRSTGLPRYWGAQQQLGLLCVLQTRDGGGWLQWSRARGGGGPASPGLQAATPPSRAPTELSFTHHYHRHHHRHHPSSSPRQSYPQHHNLPILFSSSPAPRLSHLIHVAMSSSGSRSIHRPCSLIPGSTHAGASFSLTPCQPHVGPFLPFFFFNLARAVHASAHLSRPVVEPSRVHRNSPPSALHYLM